MASMDPSEQEIANVCDFTGLDPIDDRFLVTQALKNNNRDVEAVVTQFFDNAESFRKKYQTVWDESLFTADRDGGENPNAISFHIEAPDQNEVIHGVTPPPDGYGLGAPSRPPSRSNTRSPLGRTVDWVANSATGVPNNPHDDDDGLQRALRESAQEAGLEPSHMETGVTDASTAPPVFGPAKRDDYEQDDWAMIPVSPAAETRFIRTPAASARKRVEGAPALLVQGVSSSDHRLGGLLTILHEIPLARNILLESGTPAASYGHNSEWWNGQEILPPHVLAQMQSGELQWGHEGYKPEFDEELHRLMAFLDSTERSYGTVSVMNDLIPYANLGPEKQFYERLGSQNGDIIKPLMTVASLTEVQGDNVAFEEARFGLLEMDHLRTDYQGIQTLYESLDHVMWNDVLSWKELHDASKMAMFKEMGDVFIIKVGGDGPENSFEIPEVLYPERYLDSRKDEARRIQKGWCNAKIAMTKALEVDAKAYEWTDHGTGRVLDKRDLINKATEQWKGYSEYLDGLARFHKMEQAGFLTDKYPDYRAAPCDMNEEAKERFQRVQEVVQFCERSTQELQALSEERKAQIDRIKAKQRFLGRLLTVPDKPGRQKPFTCKQYLLRGIATAKDVVYVCQRAGADLIDLEDDPKPVDQWWRLAYSAQNEESPVKTEKVEVEQMFRDLWRETKTPLLVYATEEALQTPRAALPGALERFMKADNKSFRQELQQETAETQEQTRSREINEERKRPGALDALSPSKRKHRSDSIDSMDSNRASIGSEDRSAPANPFSDYNSADTELMEVSGFNQGFARSASVESSGAFHTRSSTLPEETPTFTENTSATMTPSTMTAGSGEVEDERTIKTEVVEVKSPEMKERGRPISFMGKSPGTSDPKQSTGPMDLDLLD